MDLLVNSRTCHVISIVVPGLTEALARDVFDSSKYEIETLVFPELSLVKRQFAHDIGRWGAVIASDSDAKAVEAQFAPEGRDNALDTVMPVRRASLLNRETFWPVIERVREYNE